jgi:hypothetical protein
MPIKFRKGVVRILVSITSIIIGLVYTFTTDRGIYESLRISPGLSFTSYSTTTLLVPSFIFFMVGVFMSYLYIQLFITIIAKQHIIIIYLYIILGIFLFYFLTVAGNEIYWLIILRLNKSYS